MQIQSVSHSTKQSSSRQNASKRAAQVPMRQANKKGSQTTSLSPTTFIGQNNMQKSQHQQPPQLPINFDDVPAGSQGFYPAAASKAYHKMAPQQHQANFHRRSDLGRQLSAQQNQRKSTKTDSSVDSSSRYIVPQNMRVSTVLHNPKQETGSFELSGGGHQTSGFVASHQDPAFKAYA